MAVLPFFLLTDIKHALGFQSRSRTYVLFRIEINTVNLNGKYFTVHINEGSIVKRGQLMVEFDKEQIERVKCGIN